MRRFHKRCSSSEPKRRAKNVLILNVARSNHDDCQIVAVVIENMFLSAGDAHSVSKKADEPQRRVKMTY